MLKRELAEILADTDTRIGTHQVKVERFMERTHAALERMVAALSTVGEI
jgi:hypothetical protein